MPVTGRCRSTGTGCHLCPSTEDEPQTGPGTSWTSTGSGSTADRRREFVLGLLTATASRKARLGCFGLHEWAMAYRTQPEDFRHTGWPLRLGHHGTDEVVESIPVNCTRHDTFRFFTPQARPRNACSPNAPTRCVWSSRAAST
ncbi:hypothetical protein [Saccharopolyspora hattusasensis]|uniref:hypothetical protein n=1 Tax=Saccharopolyspora hattusasensis TaxID=1128679 RepID=UPI003D97ED21